MSQLVFISTNRLFFKTHNSKVKPPHCLYQSAASIIVLSSQCCWPCHQFPFPTVLLFTHITNPVFVTLKFIANIQMLKTVIKIRWKHYTNKVSCYLSLLCTLSNSQQWLFQTFWAEDTEIKFFFFNVIWSVNEIRSGNNCPGQRWGVRSIWAQEKSSSNNDTLTNTQKNRMVIYKRNWNGPINVEKYVKWAKERNYFKEGLIKMSNSLMSWIITEG